MRPGEWAPVLLLQLQIFLIIAVLLIAKPVGNAIYVSRFGAEALPYAYILTAVAAAIISTSYSQAVKYWSILRVNLWSLGICITTLLFCVLLIPVRNTENFIAIALYLWVALFGVLAASQFWTMASMVFDIRQAKRLFGPIGAGAIAGGITGGYLASILAETLGTRFLLILAAGMLVPVILISMYVWQKYIARISGKRQVKMGEKNLLKERPHQLILKSRHLMLLCGIIAMSVITGKLVDYQFSALASARYADPQRLTAFFGFWFSTFNVIGLLIQLLLTQRVMQRLGVSGALMFLPAGLGIGAFLMLFIPTLGTAIFSRSVDGSLKQSLHRAGVEMLYLPVNSKVKNRIKTYIDVLIDSAAGGMGGLLLIILIDYVTVSPAQISWLVLCLSTAWFSCVLAVREEYLDAFRSQLAHLRPKRSTTKAASRHHEVMSSFLKVLENEEEITDPNRLLYVLERTENIQEDRFLQPTERLLFHTEASVRARALHNLSINGKNDLYDLVVYMLDDKEVMVKKAALEYLINNHLDTAKEVIQKQLEHEDPEIAGVALIDLLIETNGNEVLRERWRLQHFFARKVAELDKLPSDLAYKWRLHLLVAAGRSGSNIGNRFIARELRSSDEEVAKVAIIAAGETLAERWLLPLIDFLSEAPFRKHAVTALVQYGPKLVRLMPRYLKEGLIDLDDLRRLPAVIEGIRSEKTVALLFSMLERHFPHDLELRMEVFRSLNAIRRDFPEIPLPRKRILRHLALETERYRKVQGLLYNQRSLAQLSLNEDLQEPRNRLIKKLKKRKKGTLDRLFRLLGLYYEPADIIPIYRGLKTSGQKERISAMEFLDTLLEPSLKKNIMSLMEIDNRAPKQLSGITLPDYPDLIEDQQKLCKAILRGNDDPLKLDVLNLLCHQPDGELLEALNAACKSAHPGVRSLALKARAMLLEYAGA